MHCNKRECKSLNDFDTLYHFAHQSVNAEKSALRVVATEWDAACHVGCTQYKKYTRAAYI